MGKEPYSDRRWRDEPAVIFSQCNGCLHYKGFGKCVAFPDNIPEEIIRNKVKHDKGYTPETTVYYEPKQ